MIELNDTNGASHYTQMIARMVMDEFPNDDLLGAEFGVAYGGGVERIGKMWKDRGTIYGFDTFTGHPKEVAKDCKYTQEAGGDAALATWCMDAWYQNPDYGREAIKLDNIQSELDRQGLENVILYPMFVDDKKKLPFRKKMHYCLIDLDFPISMWNAWNMVKNRIHQGGYLCLHDVIPKGHIHGNYEYYQQMLKEGSFIVYKEIDECLLAILKRIK